LWILSETWHIIAQSRDTLTQGLLLLNRADGIIHSVSRYVPINGLPLQQVSAPFSTPAKATLELSEASYLRLQAQRCRKICQVSKDPELIETLSRLAREFDQRAAELEADVEPRKLGA
jgi:hypothetical protein